MKSFAKKTLLNQASPFLPRRGFAATVTVNMPKFELHKLEEKEMPKAAVTNK